MAAISEFFDSIRYRTEWALSFFPECDGIEIDIDFDLFSTRAGEAWQDDRLIKLNPVFLMSNPQKFIREIVTHEVAHIIQDIIYPGSQAHGKEWKKIMRTLGVEPNRCHDFDCSLLRRRTVQYAT